jgi:sugar phosphate isomerase/epimerase
MSLAGLVPLPIGVWLDDLRLGLRDSLARTSAWRLEAVGLNAFDAEIDPRTLSASGRRDLEHRIRASGARLTAVRADVGGRRLAEAARLDVNLARLRDAAQLARDLHAPCLAVPLGFLPPAREEGSATTRNTWAEGARALLDFGTSLGVRIAAVPCGESAEDLSAFLHETDAGELLAVDLQPGLFVSRGQDPLAALNALASRVCLATALDYFRGGGEAPFGKGDVPWGHVIVGLSSLSGRGGISLLAGCSREGDRTAALQATVVALRALRANPLS